MARTFFEKVWSDHLIKDLGDGAVLLQIDRLFLHDTAYDSFRMLQKDGRVRADIKPWTTVAGSKRPLAANSSATHACHFTPAFAIVFADKKASGVSPVVFVANLGLRFDARVNQIRLFPVKMNHGHNEAQCANPRSHPFPYRAAIGRAINLPIATSDKNSIGVARINCQHCYVTAKRSSHLPNAVIAIGIGGIVRFNPAWVAVGGVSRFNRT